MKKLLLIIIIAVQTTFSISAKQITADDALQVATNYLGNSSSMKKSSKSLNLQLVHMATQASALKSTSQNVMYYVFNTTDDTGYVIIAGDDVSTPIIGYSTTSSYHADNLPPAFSWWMEGVEKGIAQAIANNEKASEATLLKWDAYRNNQLISLKSTQAVSPFVKTRWSQYAPYNNLCPTVSGSTRAVTGCVATTMAQIIKYYNYPTAATGTTPAYTTRTKQIVMPAVTLGATYNYAQMPNIYNAQSTATQNGAVALLMYHCGVSVEMDYAESSGAYSSDGALALLNYFNYDQSMKYLTRTYYDDSAWKNAIKTEIDASRPVYYSGTDPLNGGHAFICDGYDSQGLFHFNWGWGGYEDGYFTLDNPNGFTNYQAVITNIKPNQGGAVGYQLLLSNIAPKKTVLKKNESFEVQLTSQDYNFLGRTFTGKKTAVLTDSNDNILRFIDYKNVGFYYFYCTIPQDMPTGKYKLRFAAELTTGNWTLIESTKGNLNYREIEVLDKVYEHGIALKSGLGITSTEKQGVGNTLFTVTAGIMNGDVKTAFAGDINVAFVDKDQNIVSVISANRYIDLGPQYYYNSAFSFACKVPDTTLPGDYNLTMVARPTGGNWSAIAGQDATVPHSLLFTVNTITGVENSKTEGIKIYPNPVKDVLTVSVDNEQGLKSVKLFDLSGKLLQKIDTKLSDKQAELQMGSMPSGMYLIHLDLENGTIVKKVIKE